MWAFSRETCPKVHICHITQERKEEAADNVAMLLIVLSSTVCEELSRTLSHLKTILRNR